MEFLLEQFFEASRAKWWQLLGAVVAGAMFGLIGVLGVSEDGTPVLPYMLGGAVVGLVAGIFLLWVDAAQRCRELKNDVCPALRERFLAGCIIIGLTLGALSAVCGVIMLIVHAVELVRTLV